jgi:hypothetical protein
LHTVVPAPEQQAKMIVHGLRTSQSGLYFLVADNPRVQNARIVHTDYRGVYQGLVQLPSTGEVLDFDVEDNGSPFVLVHDRASPSPQAILIYRPDGTLDRSLPASKTATALALAGQEPVILVRAAPAPSSFAAAKPRP